MKDNTKALVALLGLILPCASGSFALTGCCSLLQETVRVGSYNIRVPAGDIGTPNEWRNRRADLVALVRKLDLDVFGMQEVCPDQMTYLREALSEYEFVGEHWNADRVSGEAEPVCYRKGRFKVLKKGTFWLSETPDVPGTKGWGAACPRVCSYLVLEDKKTGKAFCFANTHADNVSGAARKNGLALIVNRMKALGSDLPVVLTGDHNCCYEAPPAVFVRKSMKDARDIAESKPLGPHYTLNRFGKIKDGLVTRHGVTKDFCIDYIYVSNGMRVFDFVTHADKRPGTDLYPSDHFPITATIRLP